MATLMILALVLALVVEAPRSVQIGEAVECRVLRAGVPLRGAELSIAAPAQRVGTVVKKSLIVRRTPEAKGAIRAYLGRVDRVPVMAASTDGWCRIRTPAGGDGFVECSALSLAPWGQPLGGTDRQGRFRTTDLSLAAGPVEVEAWWRGEPASARIEILPFVYDHRETVAPGIKYRERHWVRQGDGPFTMQILELDPANPAANILPVRAQDRSAARETVSSMARRYGATAAVNGGYFTPTGASAGVYLWNREVISRGAGQSAIAWCEETGGREKAVIAAIDADARLPGCRPTDITGGGPRLVAGGRIQVADEGFRHAPVRHPRTAFAITRQGTFLFVTLDGRQTGSAGMTLAELSAELVAMGAREAVNLDGGGSTTMVVDGRVRNSPSDGMERPVSDAILMFSIPDRKSLEALQLRLGGRDNWRVRRLIEEAESALKLVK